MHDYLIVYEQVALFEAVAETCSRPLVMDDPAVGSQAYGIKVLLEPRQHGDPVE